MGVSVRVYVVGQKNIKRIPFAKFERLYAGNIKESLPEYAGERLRIATVYLETERRKPVRIIQIDYELISFDENGKIDQKLQQEKMNDAMNTIDLLPLEKNLPANVIDSSSMFAKKTYQNKHKWTPSDAELQKIIDLIFH